MCILSLWISLLINVVLSIPPNTLWPPQSTIGSYSTVYCSISWYAPSCAAVAVKVLNESSLEENATIWLQVGNITSNLTITYGLTCSESSLSYTTVPFMISEIPLVNLTAETMYCYSIDTACDATVVGSCNGAFTTTAEASPPRSHN